MTRQSHSFNWSRHLVALIMAACAFIGTGAAAATPATSAPPVDLRVGECDPSMNLLNAILSGLSGQTMGSSLTNGAKGDFRTAATVCRAGDYVWNADTPTGPVAKLFDNLGALAMIFGGAMLIYFSLIGTIKSAEDGEVLGKHWSPFWVTARTSVGFTMLTPTSSGFALVQICLLILVGWGVGGANWLWRSTIDSTLSNPAEMVAMREVNQASMTNLMRASLKGETCVRVMNRQVNGTSTYGRTVLPNDYDPAKSKGDMIIQWGQIIDGENTGTCGSIRIEGRDSYYNPTNLFSGPTLQAQQIVQRATGQGILAAAGTMAPLAEKITNHFLGTNGQKSGAETFGSPAGELAASAAQAAKLAVLRKEIFLAASNGAKTMGKEISTQASQITGGDRIGSGAGKTLSKLTEAMMQGTIDDAKRLGWVGAATLYYQVTKVNSTINSITSKIPEINPPTLATDTTQYAFPVQINGLIDSAFSKESMGTSDYVYASNRSDIGDSGTNGVVSGIRDRATRAAYEFIGVDNENPRHAIVQLKAVGDTLIESVEAALLAKQAIDMGAGKLFGGVGSKALDAASSAAASTISFGPLAKMSNLISGDAGRGMLVLGIALVFALYVGAIALAFWLPMAPFVIFLGGIFGWVVSVLEMLAASILWMIAHLHPEGEGMAGKYGANGWMIIIEAVARPALMVVGLILANAVVDPFLRFSSVLFFFSMDYATSESLSVITSFVVFASMNIALMVIMVHRSYALIYMIPNSVFKWIGAHANSYDDGAFSEAIKGPMTNAIQKVGGAAAEATPGLMTFEAASKASGAKQTALGNSREAMEEAMKAATSNGGRRGGANMDNTP